MRIVEDIRSDIEAEGVFVKGNTSSGVLPHLEKIIKLYNELYAIKQPSVDDKVGFSLLKSQYRILCAINRRKPNKNLLNGDF